MRTIHNYMEAAKQRREDGEAGFSLIELIIVVVILGILVAVAIPLVGALQQTALENSVKTAAADAATQAAAQLSQGEDDEDKLLPEDTDDLTYDWATAAPTSVDDLCVKVTSDKGDFYAQAGPADGCAASGDTTTP